jgi:Cu-Zn family superoxide dismutase
MRSDGLALTLACSMPTRSSSRAIAELKDKDGKAVGMSTFREATGGVMVNVNVKGVTPGLHAVHVHAVGKCEGPGLPAPPAISIQRKGNADIRVPKADPPEICPICWLPRMAPRFEVFTDAMTLRSGTTSVFDVDGSALIVHTGIDD